MTPRRWLWGLPALLLFSCAVHAQWVWQHPLPQGNRLWKAQFAGARIGYAVGDAGTILVTYDGGSSWLIQYEAVTDNLLDVALLDSVEGFIVGDNGQLMHTTDGGYHWLGEYPGTVEGLNCILFTDRQHGIIGGDARTILRTTDGGATWNPASLPPGDNLLTINSVGFTSTTEAFATGSAAIGGTLYRSTDAGASWSVVSMLPGSGLRLRFGPTQTDGILVGTGGMIEVTTNGGSSWAQVSSGTTTSLNDVVFVSPTEAYIAGDDSTLLHSTNGGVSWTPEPFHGTYASINGLAASGSKLLAVGEFGFMALQTSGTWKILNPGNFDAVNWIVFADRTHGFAAGQYGQMMRTSDGGSTWTDVHNGITLDSFYGAAIVGQQIWAVGDLGVVLHSSDGGTSWSQQSTGTLLTLLSIWFTDGANGWIAGDQGTLLKTTNGGQNWLPQNSGTTAVLFGVAFTGPSTGWVTGDLGTVLHTTDGGSWAPQTSNTTSALFAPSFVDAGNGFAAGGNGIILRTTNGGVTWISYATGKPRNIYLASGKSLAAVRAVGDTGLILLSENGGVTWNDDFAGTAYNLFGLYVRDDTTAWISGDNSSILFLSGRGGVPASVRLQPGPGTAGRGGFALEPNYPNPFNPSTTIRYRIDRASDVDLRLFNVLGQEVAVLERGRRDPGTHTLTWSGTLQGGRSAPSGIYFLRLTVDGAPLTQKLCLIR